MHSMKGREIEFKFRVEDENALAAFARSLGLDPEDLVARRQVNTFFDSADGRLREQGLALRLRIQNQQVTLTIKGKGVSRSEDGALVERFEAERAITRQEADAILAGSLPPLRCLQRSRDAEVESGVASIQSALGGKDLVFLGSFETERTTLPAVELEVGGRPERIVFELDRTTFPGGRIDCEIEAEIRPESDFKELSTRLRELFARAGIEWSPAPSKLARLVRILEEKR